jgi:predicted secreted protein
MTLTEQDNGRTVEIGVGSLITLHLKENPTTGYRWQLESSGGLEMVGDRFALGGAMGAAGTRVFEFRAGRAGAHVIRLKNRREWENQGAAAGSFEITVVVK